jgi:hypothetical protein
MLAQAFNLAYTMIKSVLCGAGSSIQSGVLGMSGGGWSGNFSGISSADYAYAEAASGSGQIVTLVLKFQDNGKSSMKVIFPLMFALYF